MIVLLPPIVYSRTDSGVVSPARVALTESRNSGLKGSDERLSNALPVGVTMSFQCTNLNPAPAESAGSVFPAPAGAKAQSGRLCARPLTNRHRMILRDCRARNVRAGSR